MSLTEHQRIDILRRLKNGELITCLSRDYSRGLIEKAINQFKVIESIENPTHIDDNISYMLSQGHNPYTLVKMGIDSLYLANYLDALEKEYVADVESPIIFTSEGAISNSFTLPGENDAQNAKNAIPLTESTQISIALEEARISRNVHTRNSGKGRKGNEMPAILPCILPEKQQAGCF